MCFAILVQSHDSFFQDFSEPTPGWGLCNWACLAQIHYLMPLDNPAGSWSGRDRDPSRSQTRKQNRFRDVQEKRKANFLHHHPKNEKKYTTVDPKQWVDSTSLLRNRVEHMRKHWKPRTVHCLRKCKIRPPAPNANKKRDKLGDKLAEGYKGSQDPRESRPSGRRTHQVGHLQKALRTPNSTYSLGKNT